jgi:methionyl-tRNA formyltransferase
MTIKRKLSHVEAAILLKRVREFKEKTKALEIEAIVAADLQKSFSQKMKEGERRIREALEQKYIVNRWKKFWEKLISRR